MREIVILLIFSLILSFNISEGNVLATHGTTSSDIQLGVKDPSALSSLSVRSPLRSSWEKAYVNAVYNEPRSGPRFHQGPDYRTKSSSDGSYKRDVYAIRGGKVYGIGETSNGNIYVIIQHTFNGYTFYSNYQHLDSYSVSKGQTVYQTTKIGVSGQSGTYDSSCGCYRPHLHWEMDSSSQDFLTSRKSIDPWRYLKNYYTSDLDAKFVNDNTFFKDVYHSGNRVYATIYGRDSISGDLESNPDPVIFIKYDGDSTWNGYTMNYSNGYLYYYDIQKKSGKTFAYYTIQGTIYSKYAYYPAIWKHPNSDPNTMESKGYSPGYNILELN